MTEMNETTTTETTLHRVEELIGDDIYILIMASNPSGAELDKAFQGINPALSKKALKSLKATPEVIAKFKEEWARADALGLDGQRVEHALNILFEYMKRGLV